MGSKLNYALILFLLACLCSTQFFVCTNSQGVASRTTGVYSGDWVKYSSNIAGNTSGSSGLLSWLANADWLKVTYVDGDSEGKIVTFSIVIHYLNGSVFTLPESTVNVEANSEYEGEILLISSNLTAYDYVFRTPNGYKYVLNESKILFKESRFTNRLNINNPTLSLDAYYDVFTGVLVQEQKTIITNYSDPITLTLNLTDTNLWDTTIRNNLPSRIAGIHRGDWFKYTIKISGNLSSAHQGRYWMYLDADWFSVLVTDVDSTGKVVTFETILHYLNRTTGFRNTQIQNIETGASTHASSFVAANLTVNDPIYLGDRWTAIAINGTEDRMFAFGVRKTNYLLTSTGSLSYYTDQATGACVEQTQIFNIENPSEKYTLSFMLTDSNVWKISEDSSTPEASSKIPSIDQGLTFPWLYVLLVAVAVMVGLGLLVGLKRTRR